LHKSPANGHLVLPAMATLRRFAGTRRVHFGTGGHFRATRDVSRRTEGRGRRESIGTTGAENSCKNQFGVAHAGASLTTSFAREGVRR
jgi:hypothetical protein